MAWRDPAPQTSWSATERGLSFGNTATRPQPIGFAPATEGQPRHRKARARGQKPSHQTEAGPQYALRTFAHDAVVIRPTPRLFMAPRNKYTPKDAGPIPFERHGIVPECSPGGLRSMRYGSKWGEPDHDSGVQIFGARHEAQRESRSTSRGSRGRRGGFGARNPRLSQAHLEQDRE